MKWPDAEDKARIKNQIDDVGDPEQTHGDGGVTGAAEDGVVQKEKENGAAAAERDARVAGTGLHDLRRRAHQVKKIGREDETRNADKQRDGDSECDGLHSSDGRGFRILFTDAARDHGGSGKAEAETYGKDKHEQRFREADGGDGVCAEAAHPENVDDGEERFEHHFQHHRNGEENDGAIEIAGSVVLVRAAEGFGDGLPERRHGCGDRLFRRRHREPHAFCAGAENTNRPARPKNVNQKNTGKGKSPGGD